MGCVGTDGLVLIALGSASKLGSPQAGPSQPNKPSKSKRRGQRPQSASDEAASDDIRVVFALSQRR